MFLKIKFTICLVSWLLLQHVDSETVLNERNLLTTSSNSKETIRIGSTNATPEDLIRQASQIPGIDLNAINELLKTKQPIIKTTNNDQGQVIHSTYTLEADGSIKIENITNDNGTTKSNDGNFIIRNSFDGTQRTKFPTFDIDQRLSTRFEPNTHTTISHEYVSESKPHIERYHAPTNIRLSDKWNTDSWPYTTYNHQPSSFDFDFNKPSWFRLAPPQPEYPFVTTTPKNKIAIEQTTHVIRDEISKSNDLKPITTLKLEDIPVHGIYKDGQPVHDSFLQDLPQHLRPLLTTPRTISTQNIPQTEWLSVGEHPNQQTTQTNVRSYHRTFLTNNSPTVADLDPKMQEVLRNANINPDDIPDLGNGTKTITKTRQEPDGRVISTTFTIKSSDIPVPASYPSIYSSTPTSYPNLPYPSHSLTPTINAEDNLFTRNSYTPPANGWNFDRTPTVTRYGNTIDEVLTKHYLTRNDIKKKNGQIVKTFTDEDGNVLTLTFLLSSPTNRNNNTEEQTPSNPLK